MTIEMIKQVLHMYSERLFDPEITDEEYEKTKFLIGVYERYLERQKNKNSQ